MSLENKNFPINNLLVEIASECTRDIGLDINTLINKGQGLDIQAINTLVSRGWNVAEVKDLITLTLYASDENRIGVFGSMSRGKHGFVESKENLAHDGSDIDIIIEINPNSHHKVSIDIIPSYYSGRPLNIFTIEKKYAQSILGPDYSSVIWVFENAAAQDNDIYRFVYGWDL